MSPKSRTADVRRTVAHIVPEYLPRSATFIHTLIRHQRHYDPVVITNAVSNTSEFPVERLINLDVDDAGIVASIRSRAGGYGSRYAHAVGQTLERERCSVAHAHFGWSGRDAVDGAEKSGIPLVTTLYGRDLSLPERTRRRNPYRRLFASGAVFVVEGPAMADHAARVGCDRTRLNVVPIGIDLERFRFVPKPRKHPFVVLQAARFEEKKGFDLTIRAFGAAQVALGPSELWLVGDGSLRAELEDLTAELDLSEVVRFHGMVSHDDYHELAANADVCIQPSRTAADGDTEGGAPTVLIEMQAIGVPVVATRHADIPFVVARPEELVDEEDVDGLAVALAVIATESVAARADRQREGRAFVERQHDARRTAAAVERLYEKATE
jgi:glycosyltransferase involved in cell wall biosynthesis